MAKNGAWNRFREREKERAEQEHEELNRPLPGAKTNIQTPGAPKPLASDLTDVTGIVNAGVLTIIEKGSILIEQIQNLYTMYIAGMEKTPPIVLRKQLDDISVRVSQAAKPTAAIKFQVQQFMTKYTTYVDKWERLQKDIEAGRVIIRKRGGDKKPPRF